MMTKSINYYIHYVITTAHKGIDCSLNSRALINILITQSTNEEAEFRNLTQEIKMDQDGILSRMISFSLSSIFQVFLVFRKDVQGIGNPHQFKMTWLSSMLIEKFWELEGKVISISIGFGLFPWFVCLNCSFPTFWFLLEVGSSFS